MSRLAGFPESSKNMLGITVPVSSAQKITQDHAALVLREHQINTQIPDTEGVQKLIVQMDGSMIPRSRNSIDQRQDPENRPSQDPHRRLEISEGEV